MRRAYLALGLAASIAGVGAGRICAQPSEPRAVHSWDQGLPSMPGEGLQQPSERVLQGGQKAQSARRAETGQRAENKQTGHDPQRASGSARQPLAPVASGPSMAPAASVASVASAPSLGPAAPVASMAAASASDAASPAASAASPVRVVAAGSVPFVISRGSGNPPQGLSVDVWSAAARELGLRYEMVLVPNISAAIRMVRERKADVAVGPISITASRAEQVAFTQPYFNASLGILAPPSGSLLDRIKPFFTAAFVTGLTVFASVLLIVGALSWLAERKGNPEQFPPTPWAGMGNGIWLALVTMTTVGYGDKAPRSLLGRAIIGLWMMLAMILASSLTAFMATALTLSQIDRPSIATAADLSGRSVAVVRQTTSEKFAAEHGARLVKVSSLRAAIAKLQQQEAKAVVFDKPMLRHWLRENPEQDLEMSPMAYWPQGYGFALPLGSELRQALDVAILRLSDSGLLRSIADRWLGKEQGR